MESSCVPSQHLELQPYC